MDVPSNTVSWVDKRILAVEWLKDDLGLRLHFSDGTSAFAMVRCHMGNPFTVEFLVSEAEQSEPTPDVVVAAGSAGANNGR